MRLPVEPDPVTSPQPLRAVEWVRRVVAAHPVATGLALFTLASLTRLALISTSRFTTDEIEEWSAACRLVSGKEFPLLGPAIASGAAKIPGPLLYYVGAVPLVFTRAPEACFGFIALLGAAAVVIYWQALRGYFTETGALLAGVMMACSPWSTLYADRIWNPNVVGPFVALAFWAACRVRRSPSLFAVVVLFMSMGAALQLHMASATVCLALLPIWLPSTRRWRWYWPIVATGATALLYIPLFIFELRTGGSNTLAFFHQTATGTNDDYVRVPLWAFRLLTLDISYHQLHGYWGPLTEGQMFSFLLHGNADFIYGPVRWFLLALSIVFAVSALVLAGVRAWTGSARREPHPFFWAATVGLVANTALLGADHKVIHGHYVQELLPFYFVVFAALGDWAATARQRTAGLVFGAALLVAVGGVDVAVWNSRTLDARNGLSTMRQVIAAIEKEDPNATRASITVAYRSLSAARLNELTALDRTRPFHFDQGDQYGRVILQTGPVTLYRMR
jgi:hypothetical protein